MIDKMLDNYFSNKLFEEIKGTIIRNYCYGVFFKKDKITYDVYIKKDNITHKLLTFNTGRSLYLLCNYNEYEKYILEILGDEKNE